MSDVWLLGVETGEELLGALAVIVLLVGLSLLAIIGVGAHTVVVSSREDFRFHPATAKRFHAISKKAARNSRWAEENGFEWVGGYSLKALVELYVAVWKNDELATYLTAAGAGDKLTTSFITQLTDGCDLSTSSSKDEVFLPNPRGEFEMAFTGLSQDELWLKHWESYKFLNSAAGLRVEPIAETFEEYAKKGIHAQTRYIRSIFLWPLRIPYWYFVRRNLRVNKSIEELFPLPQQHLPQ